MWLDKKKLEIMEDGKLFTENDGLVQIYDQGFCLDNTIVSGRFNSISAIKCQHVNPTKTFSVQVKNNVTKEQEEQHQELARWAEWVETQPDAPIPAGGQAHVVTSGLKRKLGP